MNISTISNPVQTRIEQIPGWQRNRFLSSLHSQAAVRTLSSNQFTVLSKIERENGIKVGESKLMFLEGTEKGWPRVWAVIEAKYGDSRVEDPVSHEVWQYMGTINGVHEFRHRSLNGKRVYERVPVVSSDFESR